MSCGSAVVRGRVGRLCCSFEGCSYLLSNKVYVRRVGCSRLRAALDEKFARTTRGKQSYIETEPRSFPMRNLKLSPQCHRYLS